VTPKTLPGYASWKSKAHAEVKAQTCIHCHQVAEILRQPAVDLKTFNKQRDFEVWPLPENVGLTLDRDHGLLVTKVEPNSAAAKAGLRGGDELGAAGGRRLFGQADFRGVLHRGPRGAGSIDVHWTRGGKVMSAKLDLADGWRKTVLDWRMSVSQGNVGGYPSFFPLAMGPPKRQQRGIPAGTMAVEPYLGPKPSGPAFAAGVRGSDAVTAVGGESPDLAGRAFLVWFKMRYEKGDQVTLTLKDPQGRERTVSYGLAE
jgi:S1-C subfamily serine protease